MYIYGSSWLDRAVNFVYFIAKYPRVTICDTRRNLLF